MYTVNNFIGSDRTNPNIVIKDELGSFTVVEYEKDLSVTPETAAASYYSSLMNIRRRQLICDLSNPARRSKRERCSGCWGMCG